MVMTEQVDIAATQAAHNAPGIDETEGDGWTILNGRVSKGENQQAFRNDGIEPLAYNNPFAQGIERVWFDDMITFALDSGELEIDEAGDIKVAKEYQCVYSVELDDKGKAKETEAVAGQLNIYDSIPGMDEYSPIWQFYYVVVPRDYEVNKLRSAQACEQSGYQIHKSNDFEN